ncbi:hypothetical protein AB0I51_03965 [Streptomyces sp. NPDC050549]|uniref:hypothetical protein n=1 Tax=Streptomyces sp. NPDC050549 TaxID=3155406 RepID=UPI0034350104
MSVLLCTSIFAADLSTHNVTMRYLYDLSVDGILDVLIGGSETSANILLAVACGLAALGIVAALVHRRTKPAVYARIGRQDL